jgi:DNA-directed RNA polymerase specialized sigma24 family protein
VERRDSVSGWLEGLKAGDSLDIQRLWDRYFEKLVRLAKAQLPGHTCRAFDEEDIALSAFNTFCTGAGRGLFSRLADRDDLWRLLATITTRKVIGSVRHQMRQKRGGGSVLGESALGDRDEPTEAHMAEFLSHEPTPEAAFQFAEEYDRLFNQLDDPRLQSVARLRLEGWRSEEIAEELGTTRRTIDRKLQLIRAIWDRGRGA